MQQKTVQKGTFSLSLPYHLGRGPKKLVSIHGEEASPRGHIESSCKVLCTLPVSRGSCLFCCHLKMTYFFSWSLWGNHCCFLLSGKSWLNDVTDSANNQESCNREKDVFTNWEDCVCWGTLLWMLLNLDIFIPKASKTTIPFLSPTMLCLSRGCSQKHSLRWWQI